LLELGAPPRPVRAQTIVRARRGPKEKKELERSHR
jgi:hypothetical protein